MRKVFKYDLSEGMAFQTFEGAVPLSFQIQNGRACLWMEVDEEQPHEKRSFEIVGTGHAIGRDWKYIDTAQLPPFVWHLYERSREASDGK